MQERRRIAGIKRRGIEARRDHASRGRIGDGREVVLAEGGREVHDAGARIGGHELGGDDGAVTVGAATLRHERRLVHGADELVAREGIALDPPATRNSL